MEKKLVVVFTGSHKGRARNLAEEVARECERRKLRATVIDLDEFGVGGMGEG